MGIIGGKEPVENCVVETYTRYLSTNVVFPFIREMITRDANERSERETKRNEEARRGGGEGGKERKRSERKSEANVLPNGVSISIMTALFPFGLVRAPHGYVYTQG